MPIFRRLLGLIGKKPHREPRFRVLPLHRISFELRILADVVSVRVSNISTQGIGLIWNRGMVENMQRFEGKLTIGSREFITTIEVRHQTNQMLGCLFVNANARLAAEIREYLAIEMQAIKLVHTDHKKLKTDRRGEIHWYSDQRKSEIYFIINHERIVYFHLSFLGFYVEGGDREHLRTGKSSASGMALLGIGNAGNFDIDKQISIESLRLGVRLVESAENVPSAHRNEIVSFLAAQIGDKN